MLVASLLGQPGLGNAECITFEPNTLGMAAPSDQLPIGTQFQLTHGVTFSMVDNAGNQIASPPILAEVGGALTAFTGYNFQADQPAPAAVVEAGSFFLTDGEFNPPLDIIISFNPPVSSASGIVLDIDQLESWQVQARDISGSVIAVDDLEETVNADNGYATKWEFAQGGNDNIHSIRFHYTGTGSAGFALDNFCFHRCPRATLTQVALKGEIAPPMQGGTAGGAKWRAFSVPAINGAGNNAFRATLIGGDTTVANNLGIWAGFGLPRVIRKGDAAPCVPGAVFGDFSSPVLNDLDQVAFRGVMVVGSGGVTAADAAGLWTNSASSGVLTLLAREKVAYPVCGFPPCVPVGARYKKITSLAMPDGGGVAFVASLVRETAGGVDATNDIGLWHSDANGVVDLLLRKGDVMTVNGINRTVASIVVLPTHVTYVSGTGRTLERAGGKITCRLTFSGSPMMEGIFNL